MTASARWTPARIRATPYRCSVTSGTTRMASTPPSTTGARRAGWMTAAGSSARAWPAWPRSPSPSCSPAGSSRTRSARRCCSTTRCRTRRTGPGSSPAAPMPSPSARSSRRSCTTAAAAGEPERPDRGRDHQGERAAVADHRGPARPARPPGRGPAARGRELRDEGHLGADRPAAGVPDGPGVRAPLPDGPHPGAHPDRRRRGAAVGPGADRRAREGPPAQGPGNR